MKKNFTVIKYAVFLGIGAGLLYYTYKDENASEISNALENADYFWVFLSLLFATAAHISRSYRWNMLIVPLGFTPRISHTFYSLMVGYLANLAVPRMGEITRCAMLHKSEKIPFNSLVGTVIAERAIDLIMLAVSLLIATLLEFDILSSFVSSKIVAPLALKFTIKKLALIIFALMLFSAVLFIVFRKSNSSAAWRIRIADILKGVWNGMISVMKMKNRWLFFGHTLLIWFLYFMMTYVCFFSTPATSHLSVTAGIFTFAIGGVAMTAPVQGGIGAFHWIVSQGLILFHIPATDSKVFAIIVHTSQTFLVLALGSWSLGRLLLKKKITS